MRGRTIGVICLGAAVLAPWTARALSLACSPLEDHYFFECHHEVCVPLFRAMPVRENACEWRSVITPIDPWASNALLAQAHRREVELEGVLQVTILHSLASPEREDEHWSQVQNSTITTRQEPPEVVRAEWEALAATQLRAARKEKVLVWGLFIVILGVLVVAGRLVWLRGFREKKGWTSGVGLAIGVQLLIAVGCSVPGFVVYQTGIGTMMPVALLAPMAFAMVATELVALGARWLRARG